MQKHHVCYILIERSKESQIYEMRVSEVHNIQEISTFVLSFLHCPDGEIGRHAGLRSLSRNRCAGSSPVSGTLESLFFRGFQRFQGFPSIMAIVVNQYLYDHEKDLPPFTFSGSFCFLQIQDSD